MVKHVETRKSRQYENLTHGANFATVGFMKTLIVSLFNSMSYAGGLFLDDSVPGLNKRFSFRALELEDRPWGISIGVPQENGYKWTTLQLDQIGNILGFTTSNFEDSAKSSSGRRKNWTTFVIFTPTFRSFSVLSLEDTFFQDTKGTLASLYSGNDTYSSKPKATQISEKLKLLYPRNPLNIKIGELSKFFTLDEFESIIPGGHLKFLHLWPGQNPPGATDYFA